MRGTNLNLKTWISYSQIKHISPSPINTNKSFYDVTLKNGVKLRLSEDQLDYNTRRVIYILYHTRHELLF
jgi:cell division septal protein FtsQ